MSIFNGKNNADLQLISELLNPLKLSLTKKKNVIGKISIALLPPPQKTKPKPKHYLHQYNVHTYLKK